MLASLNTAETPELANYQSQLGDWMSSLAPAIKHKYALAGNHYVGVRNRKAAATKRKEETEAGRSLAKELLANMDCDGSAETNKDRSPKWPHGFVGSISHSDHWTWAAVARNSQIRSLGIDTELVVDERTRQLIEQEIATQSEWEIAKATRLNPEQIFSVVFSAKEAFYKCWYPLNPEYFGFQQAAIEFASTDRLRIRTLKNNPNYGSTPISLDVFFLATATDVFTLTWIEQR